MPAGARVSERHGAPSPSRLRLWEKVGRGSWVLDTGATVRRAPSIRIVVDHELLGETVNLSGAEYDNEIACLANEALPQRHHRRPDREADGPRPADRSRPTSSRTTDWRRSPLRPTSNVVAPVSHTMRSSRPGSSSPLLTEVGVEWAMLGWQTVPMTRIGLGVLAPSPRRGRTRLGSNRRIGFSWDNQPHT